MLSPSLNPFELFSLRVIFTRNTHLASAPSHSQTGNSNPQSDGGSPRFSGSFAGSCFPDPLANSPRGESSSGSSRRRRSTHLVETPPRKIRGVHAMMWSDPEEEKKDLAAGHTTPKEIAWRLREKLGAMRHFQTLSSVEMEELASDCEFWSYDPGDVVLAQGKPGHFLLFIVSGSAAVYKKETHRRSSISSNTWTADTSSPLLSLSASRKNSLIAAPCASAAQKADDGVRKVASQENLAASVGLQRRIDRSLSLDAVPGPKPHPKIVKLKIRCLITNTDPLNLPLADLQDFDFLGWEAPSAPVSHGPFIRTVESSDVIGEISLISMCSRSATVVALTGLEAISMPKARFQRICHENEGFSRASEVPKAYTLNPELENEEFSRASEVPASHLRLSPGAIDPEACVFVCVCICVCVCVCVCVFFCVCVHVYLCLGSDKSAA